MLRLRRLLAIVVTPLALAPAAHAMPIDQDCAPEDLAPVDTWHAKHPFIAGATSAGLRVTAACKPSSSVVGTAHALSSRP